MSQRTRPGAAKRVPRGRAPLLMCLTVAAIAGAGFSEQDRAGQGSTPAGRDVAVVPGPDDDRPAFPMLGLVRPMRQVTISAPTDGVLMEVLVEEGRTVRAGDVLAMMDNRVLQASVELARIRASRTAAVHDAEYALASAERTLRRLARAHHQAATAPGELEDAEIERDRALARLHIAMEQAAVAAAELELERERLESLNLRAPFPGTVVRISARKGEVLKIAAPVVTLVALDSLEAEIHVPIRFYGKLNVGETYQLEADAPVSRPIESTLRYASPVIDASSRTIRCLFGIRNPDERLPSGFSVRLAPLVDATAAAAAADDSLP